MDETQQPSTSTEQTDDSEPTPERQAELRAAYEANLSAGRAPYYGVNIGTRQELSRILLAHSWEGVLPENAERQGRSLRVAELVGADLRGIDLHGVLLDGARLEGADLREANLSSRACLDGAKLNGAKLCGANLRDVDARNADLSEADLSGANLQGANLCGAILRRTNLRRANLADVRFDVASNLADAVFDNEKRIADIVWNDVPLTRVGWDALLLLGEENEARRPQHGNGRAKNRQTRLSEYEAAVRANRQLAVALRAQGLNEYADRFAYRAQVLQRKVFHLQGNRFRWGLQAFLQGLAGFGYKPQFTLGWYSLILAISSAVFCWQGAIFAHPHTPAFNFLGTAIVDAFTAIHGRGFFPTPAESGWQMGTAAFDAVAGLIIEASFIATFTQRFYGKQAEIPWTRALVAA